MSDTIVALSTAAGKAGVAVIRLSGPAAETCVTTLAGAPPSPRQAAFRRITDHRSSALLDRGLILWFPAPASFTGEDCAEFQVHGSRAVVAGLIDALCSLNSVRLAEPGEFTRRAYENGKMDLSRVEGLADLIDAETEAQRSQAVRQMEGAFADRCNDWGHQLRQCLAWLEAAIDFPDEELPADLFARVQPGVEMVASAVDTWLAEPNRGSVIRDGFQIAIVGPPNVGKSSILNAIAQRDVAIVSERAGTTRDVIEVRIHLGGYAVVLADTAGLRTSDALDPVEQEGIARALSRSRAADLVLKVRDAGKPLGGPASETEDGETSVDSLRLLNKTDLPDATEASPGELAISATTGAGMDRLMARILERIEAGYAATPHPALTRQRHRRALESCRDALLRALAATDAELCAEDLRLALRAMDQLIGKTGVEDLLDMIFRDFCIGK